MDPVFVNPNSVNNIAKILRHIGKSLGITRYGGEKRMWSFVCCDGLPFGMVLKLIEEFLVCQLCQKEFIGADSFIKHTSEEHNNVEHVPSIREFDWVVPIVGEGHY